MLHSDIGFGWGGDEKALIYMKQWFSLLMILRVRVYTSQYSFPRAGEYPLGPHRFLVPES